MIILTITIPVMVSSSFAGFRDSYDSYTETTRVFEMVLPNKPTKRKLSEIIENCYDKLVWDDYVCNIHLESASVHYREISKK